MVAGSREKCRGILLLGGSFNPPHIGHLRLALEVYESVADLVSCVHLVPCAYPPHKEVRCMLPFALRCQMLEAACSAQRVLTVDPIEAERSTPSYTWDTLQIYKKRYPGRALFFVLGADDYADLRSWYHGCELESLTSFLVVPRDNYALADFIRQTKELWPEARRCKENLMFLPSGHTTRFVPLPALTISSTLIRKRWLAGKNIDYLVPEVVLAILNQNRILVEATWSRS